MTKTRIIAPALALLAVLGLSACSTMNGLGQDVASAGHSLSREATEAQSQM